MTASGKMIILETEITIKGTYLSNKLDLCRCHCFDSKTL